MKRPTQRDLARLAGVSVSTISRYLHEGLSLKPETEARIHAAMEEIGFQPVAPVSAAPSDARQRRVIALLIPHSANGYFGALMDEVNRAAAAHDLDVMVGSVMESELRHDRYMSLFIAQGVAGIVTTRHDLPEASIRRASKAGIPMVIIDDRYDGEEPVDFIMIDDYSGGYQATSHLVQQGHVNIAFVGGLYDLNATRERRRGWRDALLRAGIDPDAQVSMTGDFSENFGQAVLPYLIEHDQPPTAVFAASDRIALGIMLAARRHNVSVPKDLSIVGFDDLPAAAMISPRLTTIHTPMGELADGALSLLVERMKDPRRPSSRIVTPVAMVEGGSVATL